MPTKIVAVSPGLSKILALYCAHRGWHTVAPETVSKMRELIERAGSIEECERGLRWFFSSKYVDEWVEAERPSLGLPFLTQNWDRFEIAQSEWKPRSAYYTGNGAADYALMRGA